MGPVWASRKDVARGYSSRLFWSIQSVRKSRRPIIIASRRSTLAKAQAQAVGSTLARLHPTIEVRYLWIESEGDKLTQASLADAGGKGLFVKAVEEALLNNKADLAVHSLKDIPVTMTPGLVLAATPKRGDVRDCLITRGGLESIDKLPHGATVGTSSPRRAAQLKRIRPDLVIHPLRGNVETRLNKVIRDGLFDATLLAMAGLERSGMGEHARFPVDPSVMVPAAGQGCLALQCRMDDHVTLSRCLPLNDTVTGEAVHAERQVIAGLSGDCHSPIAVYAQPVGDAALEFDVHALVLGPEGVKTVEARERCPAKSVRRVVKRMVKALKDQGAMALLEQAGAHARHSAMQPKTPEGVRVG
ncbi:MAG: hydroxymethylbilane synthase [Phycisphaera sp.]|nr:hydroxymethylbilane synthase [Phycisphaera sp.]